MTFLHFLAAVLFLYVADEKITANFILVRSAFKMKMGILFFHTSG